MTPAMDDQGARVARGSGMLAVGAGAALAGLVLTVAGCSQALPLGPAPAAAPAPSHLASAIVMQPGLSDPGASVSKCPVGSVALSGPGALNVPPSGSSPVSSPRRSPAGNSPSPLKARTRLSRFSTFCNSCKEGMGSARMIRLARQRCQIPSG